MPVENVEGVNYHGEGMEALNKPCVVQSGYTQPEPLSPRDFKV